MVKAPQTKPRKSAVKKRKRAPRVKILTIQEMATGIGVSTRTIDKYVKRGCPRTTIEAVQKWRLENIRAVSEDCQDDEIGPETRRAELFDKLESARARNIKNDLMEGKLIRKDTVITDITMASTRLANRYNSIGTMCANYCPSEIKATIKATIEEVIRIGFKEFCNDLGKYL